MKKLLIFMFILVFSAVTASAQVPAKPFSIYVSGGLDMPTSSSFKDGYKTGFDANAQLGFDAFPKSQFLINLGYHHFSADWGNVTGYDGGDMNIILAGGDLKLDLGLPAAPMKPFVLGGLGLAVLSWSDVTTPLGSGPVDSKSKFYFEIGGGVEFTQFFVKVKYVNIATSGSSLGFIPINVGVKF